MTWRGGLSRRSLFRAAAAAAVAAVGAAYRHAPTNDRLLAARLRSLVPHGAAAAVLGLAYLRRANAEVSTDALVTAILPGRSRLNASRTSDQRLRAVLGRSIRDDFATGRTLVLRGWVVSVTEARLAALVLTA